jgi:hypothetical protein
MIVCALILNKKSRSGLHKQPKRPEAIGQFTRRLQYGCLVTGNLPVIPVIWLFVHCKSKGISETGNKKFLPRHVPEQKFKTKFLVIGKIR